jgi:ABC-type cobalamin/Fe3+-siderophores transport system ATPase subunit
MAIKVFISYSHDSEEHRERVLVLSNQLIEDGLDCILDQYEMSPPEGWPMWMQNQIKEANFVIIICTETYYRRATNQEETGKGLGVKWESILTYQYCYDNNSKNKKFIPVLFGSDDAKYIPDPLRGTTYHCVDTEEGYEILYRQLTNQPLVEKPPIGIIKILSPKYPKVEIYRENKTLNVTDKSFGVKQKRKKTAIRRNLKNPYKYTGPLDPIKDKLVCGERREDTKSVLNGIKDGEYWAIIGPRHVGKTTFLRLIAKKLPKSHYSIYFTFEISPRKEEDFYEWLKEKILEKKDLELAETTEKFGKNKDPDVKFLHFLKNIRIKNKNTNSKIVLLFDEIEGALQIKSFLRLWRTVYHERYETDELKKYHVIIAGSSSFFESIEKPTSPYNIAKQLFLNELSDTDVEKLMDVFGQKNISIDPKAQKKLFIQFSRHPQLLQHACHLLFNAATASNTRISKEHVDDVIERLFVTNLTLSILRQDIKKDEELNKLVKDLLKGRKRRFHPYTEFSLSGAGAIKEVNGSCKIRNETYRRCLRDVFENNLDTTTILR